MMKINRLYVLMVSVNILIQHGVMVADTSPAEKTQEFQRAIQEGREAIMCSAESASSSRKKCVLFDVDGTMLQDNLGKGRYWDKACYTPTLELHDMCKENEITTKVITARPDTEASREYCKKLLYCAGYTHVDEIHFRPPKLSESYRGVFKHYMRERLGEEGWDILAMVGDDPKDFYTPKGEEPNYGIKIKVPYYQAGVLPGISQPILGMPESKKEKSSSSL